LPQKVKISSAAYSYYFSGTPVGIAPKSEAFRNRFKGLLGSELRRPVP
jgi:hypothetical protein